MDAPVVIDDSATGAHMIRAVFHRRVEGATTPSPIQFVRAMRLDLVAMRIAGGTAVREAAMVGYAGPSRFSREFRRMHGRAPKA